MPDDAFGEVWNAESKIHGVDLLAIKNKKITTQTNSQILTVNNWETIQSTRS
jgi:hypothetical protein